MRVIGVIPARYGSSRFEGKPLKMVAGKPLLAWVIEGAKKASRVDKILVATDDERIFKLAQDCQVPVLMTDPQLPSGSDRVWDTVKNEDCEIVLNIQGDEPLLTGKEIDTLVEGFTNSCEMATLGRPFEQVEDLMSTQTAKIVLNRDFEALYFSRLPLPFSRWKAEEKWDDINKTDPPLVVKHIGLYAYRKSFLKRFCEQGPVPLEMAEGLEQLRALWLGARIKVILTDYESWGVDTPEDVVRIERILNNRSHS